jgi:hypothetical protein
MNAHSEDFGMTDDLRDLSQAYRNAVKHEDDQEPSPSLDATILAAAHRAVASRPQAVSARQSLRFPRWRLPLTLAASFLIGVLVVVLFVSEESGPEPQILAQALPTLEPAQPVVADASIRERSAQFSESRDVMEKKQVAEATQSLAKPMPMARGKARVAAKTKVASMEDEKSASGIPAAQEVSAKWQSPRAWLEHIEKLRRDGKIKEARENLAEFRKHHPNHALPKALRDL